MDSNTKIRIILNILIILSIAIFPWWITAILIIVGFLLFNFYEAFVFAMLMDSVYGVPRELFFGLPFVSFLFVFVLFVFVRWFKKRLRI